MLTHSSTDKSFLIAIIIFIDCNFCNAVIAPSRQFKRAATRKQVFEHSITVVEHCQPVMMFPRPFFKLPELSSPSPAAA